MCAVSYLNTAPLVWGLVHSPDTALREMFDLRFALPSECADQIASGEADIGILPVIEMARQKLDYFRGAGIACHGPVRSILLISKVPVREIRTLATDSGSRTSVMLSRVILAEKYGAEPAVFSRRADLALMLAEADAALLTGDAALHVDPATLPFETLDSRRGVGYKLTGLPMVFAMWSGRSEIVREPYGQAFLRFGAVWTCAHRSDIAREQPAQRQVSAELAREYLTHHIVFELGERDYEGMRLYLDRALRLDRVMISGERNII